MLSSNSEKTQPQKHQKQQLEIIDPSTIFIGVDYIAVLLDEELSTIYNKSSSGRLPFPSYKTGSSVRFKYSEVMEWVENLKPIPARPKNTSKDDKAKRGRGRPPKCLPITINEVEKATL